MSDRNLLAVWLAFSVGVAWLPLPWLLRALLIAAAGWWAWQVMRRPVDVAPPPVAEPPALPPATPGPRFHGDPGQRLASRFLLGDVFSAVGADGLLEWDAQPLPGRRVRWLVACDDSAPPRSVAARAAPFDAGPFADGVALEAALGGFEFETGVSPHVSVDLVLPAAPGWYWLHVELDDHVYGPLRIEVADAPLLPARRAAFAAADLALLESGDAGPWLVAGLYAPRPVAELRALLPDAEAFAGADGGAAWPLLATRVDADGVLQPQPGKPLNRLVLVAADGGAATLHDDFALASWTLYNWPQAAPRGGYAGWWWTREGLPAGGLCGTAWCQYPFPGNLPRAWRPAMMIATPPPPDPLDWWLARRGGWICGNGWWQSRQGPGGMRFGPWWPLAGDGLPAPQPGPAGPDDPPPPPPAPPGQTRTRRKPPGLQPPPEAGSCAADFVEAVSKYGRYGNPPYGRRVQPGNGVRGIARYDRLPAYTVSLRWVRLADGWTPAGGYSYAWRSQPVDEVAAELERNRAWWAQYCITVTARELVLPDGPTLRLLAQMYRAWLDDLPRPPPGVMMGLGDDMTQRGVDLSQSTLNAVNEALAGDAGREVVVVFMPRVVGGAGHTGDSGAARSTEASFTVPGAARVLLNQLDADDPYILAHELIHAWGRPSGQYCWDHQSGHPRAMSRVTRKHIKQPAGLDASRLLDYAEYDEILSSGQLQPVAR